MFCSKMIHVWSNSNNIKIWKQCFNAFELVHYIGAVTFVGFLWLESCMVNSNFFSWFIWFYVFTRVLSNFVSCSRSTRQHQTSSVGRLRRRGVCQKHVHQKAAVDVNFKFCIFFQKINIRKLCMNRRLEKHGKYEIYSSILINVFLSNAWTSVLPWNRLTF